MRVPSYLLPRVLRARDRRPSLIDFGVLRCSEWNKPVRPYVHTACLRNMATAVIRQSAIKMQTFACTFNTFVERTCSSCCNMMEQASIYRNMEHAMLSEQYCQRGPCSWISSWIITNYCKIKSQQTAFKRAIQKTKVSIEKGNVSS